MEEIKFILKMTMSAIMSEECRAILALITTIVLGVTLGFVAFYAFQVKRSVDEMRTHRASLFRPIVVGKDINFVLNEVAVTVYHTLNLGKGPALNVRLRLEGAKYEMTERKWPVISDRWPAAEPPARLAPKEGEKREQFELKEGVERGRLIYTYNDVENRILETHIDFWKENGRWERRIKWAGKYVR